VSIWIAHSLTRSKPASPMFGRASQMLTGHRHRHVARRADTDHMRAERQHLLDCLVGPGLRQVAEADVVVLQVKLERVGEGLEAVFHGPPVARAALPSPAQNTTLPPELLA
jgi:hypothetical protein